MRRVAAVAFVVGCCGDDNGRRGHCSYAAPYKLWGARGFWSTDAWMGPWPLLYLRDLTDAGDYEKAEQVLFDITGGRVVSAEDVAGPQDNARKLGYSHAGYCDLGPNRSPYAVVKPESLRRHIARAERWTQLCKKYRPWWNPRPPWQ